MEGAVRKPDIELTRKTKEGYTQTYFHLYWKPFLIFLTIFNKHILFRIDNVEHNPDLLQKEGEE